MAVQRSEDVDLHRLGRRDDGAARVLDGCDKRVDAGRGGGPAQGAVDLDPLGAVEAARLTDEECAVGADEAHVQRVIHSRLEPRCVPRHGDMDDEVFLQRPVVMVARRDYTERVRRAAGENDKLDCVVLLEIAVEARLAGCDFDAVGAVGRDCDVGLDVVRAWGEGERRQRRRIEQRLTLRTASVDADAEQQPGFAEQLGREHENLQ
ncbi:hypothetical protein M885DRAFT_533101 [Pelagophyceae sp. CCMP2097]|nr:hypothetical protein M885DRAFT_533101 [Pelagophyceae sp. CCMP2097]|mmetsp:Transcript_32310/g.111726  ORF Transcript_32310/g.111726 Transcript_32310/m.111726 type:complete len:207 (+) Transcript_32310:844-1464(+)